MLPDFDSNEPFLFTNNSEPGPQDMETSPEVEHGNYTNMSSPFINERISSPKSDLADSGNRQDSSFVDPALVSKQSNAHIPASPTDSYTTTQSRKGPFDTQMLSLHDSIANVQALQTNNAPLVGMLQSDKAILKRNNLTLFVTIAAYIPTSFTGCKGEHDEGLPSPTPCSYQRPFAYLPIHMFMNPSTMAGNWSPLFCVPVSAPTYDGATSGHAAGSAQGPGNVEES
jgi:hypothetical protein